MRNSHSLPLEIFSRMSRTSHQNYYRYTDAHLSLQAYLHAGNTDISHPDRYIDPLVLLLCFQALVLSYFQRKKSPTEAGQRENAISRR